MTMTMTPKIIKSRFLREIAGQALDVCLSWTDELQPLQEQQLPGLLLRGTNRYLTDCLLLLFLLLLPSLSFLFIPFLFLFLFLLALLSASQIRFGHMRSALVAGPTKANSLWFI